jgi:flagella basal body P-ring formation protein FlgA
MKTRPALALSALATLATLLAAVPMAPAGAQTVPPPATTGAQLEPATVAQALALATQAAQALAPRGARVLASAGALDPRLQLAPCARVEPYLAAGVPPWGRSRVGLRCLQGATAWKVTLPVTVQVWAPAVVGTASLPAGATLEDSQLTLTEVDWAAASTPPFASAQALAGRVLARPLAAGQALRAADLQPHRWFAAGETVRVVASGAGFTIDAEGQALTPGFEGQPARVRTEGGRILVGVPVGERRLEVGL